MRDFIQIFTESDQFDPVSALARARADGFDTHNIVFHGTNNSFSEFDASKRVTAKHVYTAPDYRTAAFYGETVYRCVIRGSNADLTESGDYRLLGKVAEEFAHVFYRKAYTDPELAEVQDRIAAMLVDQNPDMTQLEAEIDAEEHDEYQITRHRVAKKLAADFLQSGNLYNFDNRGHFQDEVLDYIFGLGYTNVSMYDYSSEGDNVSIVVDSPANVRVVGVVGEDEEDIDESAQTNASILLEHIRSLR